MSELVKSLEGVLDKTFNNLSKKSFIQDPIAGDYYSKVASVVSSAYKRHGFIIEQAILGRLSQNSNFVVWDDRTFQVPNTADLIVSSAIAKPSNIFDSETQYRSGDRALQVDAIVFDKTKKCLNAYEIKRGSGLHDSGKRRSILRDLLCLQVLLKSYGTQRGLEVVSAKAHIIFYYGQCSIAKPFSLTREELDEHFGFPIVAEVELVNAEFQKRLFELLNRAHEK